MDSGENRKEVYLYVAECSCGWHVEGTKHFQEPPLGATAYEENDPRLARQIRRHLNTYRTYPAFYKCPVRLMEVHLVRRTPIGEVVPKLPTDSSVR